MTSREALPSAFGTDFEDDLLAGGFFEEAVDVVGGVEIAAIDGEEIFADVDVDAGLSERGAELRDSNFRR